MLNISVVAVRIYDDCIKIAADSIVTNEYLSKRTDGDFKKLVQVNDMIIGSVGLAEEGCLMFLFAETHEPREASVKGMMDFLVEFLRWKQDLGSTAEIENDYLVIFDKTVFRMQGMLVHEVREYAAIGAGEDFAHAALYLGHSPKKAVKVACDLCCIVAEPIVEFKVKL